MSIVVAPGSQGHVSLWHDHWHDNCALKNTFPNLFDLCTTPMITIQEAVLSQKIHIHFRRTLGGYSVTGMNTIVVSLEYYFFYT